MNLLLLGLLGFIFAILLHELTHLLVITYYKIPFKAIILTKWSTVGFLVDYESSLKSNKILALLYFSPLLWGLVFLIKPGDFFLLMFPLVNIFGGLGDFYHYARMRPLSYSDRLELANRSDEKILKSIIWKKEL